MVSSQNATAPVKEGDVLAAKYRIEKVIGVGGMGIVVSAMHLELEQRVALKFLLPQAATNDELVGRFVREAKASVKLKGTHVAQVLDVGRMDDGRAYIVMEYLEGRDLGAELKASRDQFAIEDAVSWMLQACEGLAEAHALGIVHRDLKPGNLFLTTGPDGKPLVKVLDFGISKSINPNASDMLSLTKTEMLLGSPLYMAPEQMRSSKYVDERSDIWGLGAIAYELLTRRVPFEAETLLDLCFKVAQEGCLNVDEVRPDVPAELSAVVMRCLEKEPEARFTDIGELATALEVFAAPHDHGSAARTIAILASGADRARAKQAAAERRSNPDVAGAATSGSSSDAKRISDSKKKSDAKRISGGAAKPKHISAEHLITGTATTERAPIGAPDSDAAIAATTPSDASSAPDAVPASSAWGTTNANAINAIEKKNRRSFVAIGAAVAATGVLAFVIARSVGPSPNPVPPPASTPAAVAVPPPPATTTVITNMTATPAAATDTEQPAVPTAASSTPAATAIIAPPTNKPVGVRPKPSASASAATAPKPPDSSAGGFIRVRE